MVRSDPSSPHGMRSTRPLYIVQVKYKPDNTVTDVNGPGWRTRHGHMQLGSNLDVGM